MGQEEIDKAIAMMSAPETPAPETVTPPPVSGTGDPTPPGGAPPPISGVVPAKDKPGEGAPPPPSDAKALEGKPADAKADKPGEAPETPPDPVAEALKPYQEIMQSAGVESPEQLKGTVADAMVLYDVLDGKQKASALLEAVKATQPPEVFRAILADLKTYLQEHEPGGAPPKAAGEGKSEVPNPLEQKLTDLETRFQTREQREEQGRVYQKRMDTVVIPFQKRVEELGKKEGLDEEDVAAYAAAVSAAIGQDRAALGRLESGKFGDVDRFFTEHHNKQLWLLKKYSDRVTTQKTAAQNAAPRIPAGGAPPAPAQPVTLPPAKTAEERTERARQILSGEVTVN